MGHEIRKHAVNAIREALQVLVLDGWVGCEDNSNIMSLVEHITYRCKVNGVYHQTNHDGERKYPIDEGFDKRYEEEQAARLEEFRAKCKAKTEERKRRMESERGNTP